MRAGAAPEGESTLKSQERRGGFDVERLTVTTASGIPIVENLTFSLGQGKVLGLVGESGSGKTTAALAMLGYTRAGARITSGSLDVAGQSVALTDERASRHMRGRHVSYVPQNPGTSLNPSLRVGQAIGDIVSRHRPEFDVVKTVRASLSSVGLSSDAEYLRRYPHQLSGGQQQRICIAGATVAGAEIVILDEPTTGLDVITQQLILQRLKELAAAQNVTMLYITHDLAVVAEVAHEIAVMYSGRIVEAGPIATLLTEPVHPYTRGLIACAPDHRDSRPITPMPGVAPGIGERVSGCAYAPRCQFAEAQCRASVPKLEVIERDHQVRCVRWTHVRGEPTPRSDAASLDARELEGATAEAVVTVTDLSAEHKTRGRVVTAAAGVSFAIQRGTCVALVGESGSGKTTIARTIAGLHPIARGEIRLGSEELKSLARRRTREQTRRVRIVFQNAAEALNPRQTAGQAIYRPAQLLRSLSRAEREAEVTRMLDAVRLPSRIAARYPSELSGGEQQRVCIARALIARPDLLICDEITSALDVSVQAAILALLRDLQTDLGLSMLFITHDIGVVSAIADEMLVLEAGQICESGPVAKVLAAPSADYTRQLLDAVPSMASATDVRPIASGAMTHSVNSATTVGGTLDERI